MPDEPAIDWRELIERSPGPDAPVTAETFKRVLPGAGEAAEFKCDDGHDYAVKGGQKKRMAFNDHVVAKLGAKIGAPVPTVRLVNVPAALIEAQPELKGKNFGSGVGHGSLWIDQTSEIRQPAHIDVPGNRQRFAVLAVLFGWVQASDHQFLYQNADPRLVFSHDHGHFFPGGPDWKAEGLAGPGDAKPDLRLVAECKLKPAELVKALGRLQGISAQTIASVIAVPPDDWGVGMVERVALGEFLWRRRGDLLAHKAKIEGEGIL